MRARRGYRVWITLWALLQFALPAAATYADALLERGGSDAIAHVEGGSGSTCTPVHEAECALCKVINRAVASTAPTCVLVVAVRMVPPHAPITTSAIPGDCGLLPLSRAPPIA